MVKIIIGKNEEDQRYDRLLRKHFKQYPDVKLTDIFSRIRKGAIKVNGRKRKQDYRLQLQDEVTWDDKIRTSKSATAMTKSKTQKRRAIDVDTIREQIIFEDENWVGWNKPADLVTHGGTGHKNDLHLHDLLRGYLEKTDQMPESSSFKPAFCFRLDKDTT